MELFTGILTSELLTPILNAGAVLAAIALAFFAAVQLLHQREERRERRRAAFLSLYAESWRFTGLRDSLEDEDLVVLARADALDPDDFLPRDWGTVLQLVGAVSAGTTVLAAFAYDIAREARQRARLLIELANHSPAAEADARTFEGQVKQGLERAEQLMEDALRSAPHWLREQPLVIVDPTTEVGKKVQDQLRKKEGRIKTRRQTAILGPVGRALGRPLSRLACWLDPTTCP